MISYTPGLYPLNLPNWTGSTVTLRDRADMSEALDGSVKVRRSSSRGRKRFKLVHGALTNADLAVYELFWIGERNNVFNFTWLDGRTYSCVLSDQDPVWTPQSGIYWKLDAQIWEA